MRIMSFRYTTQQIIYETKTETTRAGWAHAKPGDLIQAAEQCMGLKKGQKVKRLKVIRVLKNEPIKADPLYYSPQNVTAEGFPLMNPHEFVYEILIKKCKCKLGQPVNRITFEFEYVKKSTCTKV